MTHWQFVATLLASLILVTGTGCSSDGSTLPDDPGTNEILLRNQTLAVGADTRNYHLFVPARPSDAALVFLLHGHTGSSDQILGLNRTVAPYKVWLDIAKRENLFLVVPNGSIGPEDTRGWNDCRIDAVGNPDSNDVAFFETLLIILRNRYNLASNKVFVIGTSNGGMMTQRLADEAAENIDAIAVIVASRPVQSSCTTSNKPIRILIMNGTEDPLSPYDGGQIASNRGEVLSTADMIDHWIARNQTSTVPIIEALPDINRDDGSTITHYSYTGGNNGTRVDLYEMLGAGHTEPSLIEKYGPIYSFIVGTQNHDIEMAEKVWEFFNTQ